MGGEVGSDGVFGVDADKTDGQTLDGHALATGAGGDSVRFIQWRWFGCIEHCAVGCLLRGGLAVAGAHPHGRDAVAALFETVLAATRPAAAQGCAPPEGAVLPVHWNLAVAQAKAEGKTEAIGDDDADAGCLRGVRASKGAERGNCVFNEDSEAD